MHSMNIVYVDSSDDVVGSGHLIRLAKHNDGTMGVVKDEDVNSLFVFKLFLNADGEAEKEKTLTTWRKTAVAELFASPNDQPGVPQDGRPVGKNVSRAESLKASDLHHVGGGPIKWHWNSGTNTVTEITDTRPLLRFAQTNVRIQRQDTTTTTDVVVDRLDNVTFTGNLDVSINGEESGPKTIQLTFTNGQASLKIRRNTTRELRVETSPGYRVENPVAISVFDDTV